MKQTTTAVDRVRKLATDAIQQYSDELFAGGEPAFPEWTRDVIAVCDEHATMHTALQDAERVMSAHIYPKPDTQPDHPFSVLQRVRAAIILTNKPLTGASNAI